MTKKTLVMLGVGLLASSVMAADKFIYERDSGNIISSTPNETTFGESRIYGSRVWSVVTNWTPALGESDDLYYNVVVTNEDVSMEGVVSQIVTTNRLMRGNISELSDYTRLYPLTEDERQAAKDVGLKTLENQFIMYYGSLGFNEKPGFDEITALLQTWTNELAAAKEAIVGLSIDAAAKRYNALWWDDCAWHPEIVTP